MAKIGTAHVEIKPVLDEASLGRICDLIEARIAKAVRAGLSGSERTATTVAANPDAIAYNGLCTCQGPTRPHPFHTGAYRNVTP